MRVESQRDLDIVFSIFPPPFKTSATYHILAFRSRLARLAIVLPAPCVDITGNPKSTSSTTTLEARCRPRGAVCSAKHAHSSRGVCCR